MKKRTKVLRRRWVATASALCLSAVAISGHAEPKTTAEPKASAVSRSAPAATLHKVAIVVGANQAPPDRATLRYSHSDAQAFATVLAQVGEFPTGAVHTLLDPEPAELLRVLDEQIAGLRGAPESFVMFYYSGHADTEALYPNGKHLPLAEVRKRLDDTAITVRLGVIDSCRGGGWTGTKGLKPVETFDLGAALSLNNTGSVLIASSSGVEDAHESEALRGSFFTHHLTAGLRGAADKNRDNRVSVSEAFEYAKALTIRDTALAAPSPQHPSFRMNLRGRQDLPLTNLERGESWMKLEQNQGPLEVVHLQSGLVLLELHPGQRELRVVVPQGRYLVRRRDGGQTFAKEYTVEANRTTVVKEAQLELRGSEALLAKGDSEIVRAEFHLLSGVGVHRSPHFSLSESQRGKLGFGDRGFGHLNFVGTSSQGMEIAVPGRVGWRFGDGLQWVPWISLPYYVLEDVNDVPRFAVPPGVGFDLWWRASGRDRLGFNLGLSDLPVQDDVDFGLPRDHLRGWAALGYRRTLGGGLELNLGLGYSSLIPSDFSLQKPSDPASGAFLAVGSVATDGALPSPLLQVHLSDSFALGLDAAAHLPLDGSRVTFESSLGLSWRFAQVKTLRLE